MKTQIIVLVIAMVVLGVSAWWYLGSRTVGNVDVGEASIVSESGVVGSLSDSIAAQDNDDVLLSQLDAVFDDLNSDEAITTADALNIDDIAAEEAALSSLSDNINIQVSDDSSVSQTDSNLNDLSL